MKFFSKIFIQLLLIISCNVAYAHGGEADEPAEARHPATQIGLPGELMVHTEGMPGATGTMHYMGPVLVGNTATTATRSEVEELMRETQAIDVSRSVTRLFVIIALVLVLVFLFKGHLFSRTKSAEDSLDVEQVSVGDGVPAGNTTEHAHRTFASVTAFLGNIRQLTVVMGGLMLALLIFLLGSGIALSLFYNPQPELTYKSMVDIVEHPAKSFIRNFHYWSSDLLLLVLILHMTRVALTKPSGKPRRYAWWIGTGLLFFIGLEALLGTFLRGDHESTEAYSHFFLGVTGIAANYFPFVNIITDFFSGHTALFRFFIAHAVLMPATLAFVLVLHGLFAPTFRALLHPWKKVSDAALRGESTLRSGFFSSPSVKKVGMLIVLAFVVITVLSFILPAPFYSQPYSGIEVSKPAWWLLWIYALENVWGLAPLVFAPAVLFAVFVGIPFFTKDRIGADLGVYIYLVTFSVLTALALWAAFAPPVAHTEHFMNVQQDEHAGHNMEM